MPGSQSPGNTNRPQGVCFPASRFGTLITKLDRVGWEGFRDRKIAEGEEKCDASVLTKIPACPHLLRHLCTWLGKLGSSCCGLCPGAWPCPSPLSLSVGCKCVPDLQPYNTVERGESGRTSRNASHTVMIPPPRPGHRGALPPGACTEAGASPTEQGICSWNSEGKSLGRGRGFKGAAPGGNGSEHCCDHLAAHLGSWRSSALAVRSGRRGGEGGVVRTQLPEKGPSAGQRNGQ